MNKLFANTQQRFSIRKYAVGTASVLLGIVFLLGTSAVSADELVTATTEPTVSLVTTEPGSEAIFEPATVAPASSELLVPALESEPALVTTPPVVEKTEPVTTREVDVPPVASEAIISDDSQPLPTDVPEVVAVEAHQLTSPSASELELNSSEPVGRQGDQLTSANKVVEGDKVVADKGKDVLQKTLVVAEDASTVGSETGDKVSEGKVKEVVVATTPTADKDTVTALTSAEKEDKNVITEETSQVVQPVTTGQPRSSESITTVSVLPFRTAFRSSTRSTGPLGDTYPSKWKYLDPEKDTDDWNLNVRNCTSFTAHRLSSVNRFELPKAYGNAYAWGGRALSEGYRVDDQPTLGAVAWSAAGPDNHGAGHVAWVAAVNGDMVTVEEYNYGKRYAYNTRTVHKSHFTGFIHFKDLGAGTTTAKPLATTSTTTHGLAPQGRHTFTQQAGVKDEPKISSPDRDTYYVGESVNYDQVLEADNHVWLSYTNHRGGRSYVAIKQLTPSTPSATPVGPTVTPVSTNTATSTLPASGRYTFTQRTGVKSEAKISSPNLDFYEVGESVTYDKVLEADNHRWLSYVNFRGGRSYVAIEKLSGVTATPAPSQPVASPATNSSSTILPASGRYTFTKKTGVKNEPKLSSPDITFYGVGGSVNYDRVLQSEGRQWISYMSSSGVRRYALAD